MDGVQTVVDFKIIGLSEGRLEPVRSTVANR